MPTENNKKVKGFKKFTVLVLLAALLGAAVSGAGIISNRKALAKDSSIKFDTVDNDILNNAFSDIPSIEDTVQTVSYNDVSAVAKNVKPAVVSINSTIIKKYSFFGREYSDESKGSGSGIIIGQNASEILIVTNNHVIEGANNVEIVFSDGKTANAEIKGTESSSDIAVVSVQTNDLSKDTLNAIRIASLGNSDDVKEGEMVIAIGNAVGYGQSVTVGHISAVNREVEVEGIKLNLIQTDAAINPGNSGGALINIYGQVIGINSVKYSSVDVEGVGYAIPLADVIPIINELMNREVLDEEDMAYLGLVKSNDVSEDYANAFNMPVGVYISVIEKNSPADIAGLSKGDIITEFNGKKIETIEDLKKVLSYTRGGTTAELTVMTLKYGEYTKRTVTVTLGFRKDR